MYLHKLLFINDLFPLVLTPGYLPLFALTLCSLVRKISELALMETRNCSGPTQSMEIKAINKL